MTFLGRRAPGRQEESAGALVSWARRMTDDAPDTEDKWHYLYPAQQDVARAQQPARAGLGPASSSYAVRRRDLSPRPAGLVWLSTGIGLGLDGCAVAVAPRNSGIGLLLFLAAYAIPFFILVTVLMAASISRSLRYLTIAIIGVYPAVLYRLSSPIVLGGFDEHLHQRTLLDLLHGDGLFSPNPLLPISPYYPGMELFTGVTVRLTGMPVMLGICLVVLLFRLLLVLTLYHLALTVTRSLRTASLVVVFYAVCPQFYSFNAGFAYQTMALTLGLGSLLLLRRAQLAEGATARRLTILAILALIATVVTHHLTSWIVLGFLICWTAIAPRDQRQVLLRATAVMGITVAIWTANVGTAIIGYLGPIFTGDFHEFEALVRGTVQSQALKGSAGTPIPQWEKLFLIFYAVSCTCAAVVFGLILVQRALRYRDRMVGFLGALCLVYPSTLAAHFVPGAGELGDRASTFFFFPLALSCSLVITRDPRVTGRANRIRRPRRPVWWLSLASLTTLIYLGALFLGSGPNWEFLPGPYLVSAEARTQDPETLAAVQWAATHLPAGSRIVADRIPADLLAGEAGLWPVVTPTQGLQPASLYFSETWGPEQTAIVRKLDIRYLYVDQRLSESLPEEGYYISGGETPEPERISAAALAKFSSVPGLMPVYQHGPVTIYDTAGLGVKAEQDGVVGHHSMGLGTLGDALCGAALAGLIWALRRRLRWVRYTAHDAGAVGTGVSVMAVTTLLGGVLFALRLMPGPAFTLGAVATSAVILAVRRRRDGLRLVPRLPFPHRLDPLVLLGVVAGVAGLAIAVHAAWITDVADVNAILRAVSK